MAIHPDGDIIATGQMAAKGRAKVIDIFVWKASTLENLAQINGFHRRAVRQLQFNDKGDKLLSIGEDDQHSVAIYDWANKVKLCDAKVDPDQVFDARWKSDTEFVTCGIKHIKFFSMKGSNL
jgi:microtubule-associated protein-like 6